LWFGSNQVFLTRLVQSDTHPSKIHPSSDSFLVTYLRNRSFELIFGNIEVKKKVSVDILKKKHKKNFNIKHKLHGYFIFHWLLHLFSKFNTIALTFAYKLM
jgi:hypothetical protein